MKAEDAKDSCSRWVYVGGRQTKGGKSASVFSDAGGQRAFWYWFVLVIPPLRLTAEKEEEKSNSEQQREDNGKELYRTDRRRADWVELLYNYE